MAPMVALSMTISQTVEAAVSATNLSQNFESNMNIEMLHIGMKVRHPQYGCRGGEIANGANRRDRV
jgi:hypothetical protein